MHKITISYPAALIFGRFMSVCLGSMSIKVCCHIYNFEHVYENINMFLSNDHIWNYRNLNRHISQLQIDILFKFAGLSILIDYY